MISCIRVLRFTLKFPADLPFEAIDSTKSAMTVLARMNQLSLLPQDSLVLVMSEILDSLLDDRLSKPSASLTMKGMNKVNETYHLLIML